MERSKKVLLIYPGKFGQIFPELPMPLLYLSQALREAGFLPQILDMRLDHYASIDPQEYLFAGISIITGPQIKHGLECARFLREKYPALPLVWGGIHASLLPEQTLQSPCVDYVVVGEGEETVKELAAALYHGTAVAGIPGLGYKDGGRACLNPRRGFLDLNAIAIELPYELFKMDRYALEYFPLHTSRGCPYRCGFCYNLAFNQRRWRAKSAERVLAEIDYVVKKFSPRYISFTWEDEFFIDTERVRAIADGILKRGLKIKWDAFCRFNHFYKFDDDFIALLERSGCVALSFGGESGSQRMLDEVVKKDITVEQVVITTTKLAKTGIRQIVSFMSGLPGERQDDMDRTFALMDKLYQINRNIYLNGIMLYTPYPGTDLFKLVREKYAYRMPESLEAWADFGIYRSVGSVWQPESYLKKYKTISLLTRFPFYRDAFGLKDIATVIGAERLEKFPYNIVYYLFATSARWRWRKKFFRMPLEWWLLEKVVQKMRGFV